MSGTMNSNVTVGTKPISGLADGEEDNVDEILGYIVSMTTGEVDVPRSWLLTQWDELGLPEDLAPREPTDWMAYRRAMRSLLNGDFTNYQVPREDHFSDFNAKLRLEKADEQGSNVFILYSDIFEPGEYSAEEHGNWAEKRLGYFDYLDNDGMGGVLTHGEVEEEGVQEDKWRETANRARELFRQKRRRHNGQDMRGILDDFRKNENVHTVPVRRAVYFFGAHHEGVINALATLWERLNEFKSGGEQCEIATIPVVNTENQRELIRRRAEEMMQEMVDAVIGQAFNQLEEADDKNADKLAREVVNNLSEANSLADEYNQLLKARLSVKEVLEERREELTEEKDEIIQKVLAQRKLEDY